MQLAVSTLIIYKKDDRGLSQTIRDTKDIPNWEIIDEGLHKLNTDKIKTLRDIASTQGTKYSVHAPFSSVNLAEAEPELRKLFLKYLKKSLKRAYELEAAIWVLHSGRLTPFTYFFPEKAWDAHNNSLLALSKTAEDFGIRIAVENMPGQYELVNNVHGGKRLIDEIKRDNVGICLDIGHANLREGVKPFYSRISPEIIHIHIHDNMGKEDSHLAVGQGNIDWKNFRAWLNKIKYEGWIVFENYEFHDVQQGMKVLANLESSPITTEKASEP